MLLTAVAGKADLDMYASVDTVIVISNAIMSPVTIFLLQGLMKLFWLFDAVDGETGIG